MASFSEIRQLKEERKALFSIASELNTQLQRLKIEELALMSMVKLQEEEKTKGTSPDAKPSTSAQGASLSEGELEVLDLSVATKKDVSMEEEEDEVSEGEVDQLTMFINDLVHRKGKGTS